MRALDYLYKYSELERQIDRLTAEAAISEQVAHRHTVKKLKIQSLNEAKAKKKEAADLKQEQESIEKTVWSMPQERARVLRLHYFYGDSFREIARNMKRELEFVEDLHNAGMNNLQTILNTRKRIEMAGIQSDYGVFDAETQTKMKKYREE